MDVNDGVQITFPLSFSYQHLAGFFKSRARLARNTGLGRLKSWEQNQELQPPKSDFHVVSFCSICRNRIFFFFFFTWSLLQFLSFCNLCKKKRHWFKIKKKKQLLFFDLFPSCVHCRWLRPPDGARLRESAIVMPVMPGTSFVSQTHPRSAICPRPGSLIREESCGKVCVSLLAAPLSLQLFVRVGPRQQHRGAGDHYTSAWVCVCVRWWWGGFAHWHCENRKGEELETNAGRTLTHILRRQLSFHFLYEACDLHSAARTQSDAETFFF